MSQTGQAILNWHTILILPISTNQYELYLPSSPASLPSLKSLIPLCPSFLPTTTTVDPNSTTAVRNQSPASDTPQSRVFLSLTSTLYPLVSCFAPQNQQPSPSDNTCLPTILSFSNHLPDSILPSSFFSPSGVNHVPVWRAKYRHPVISPPRKAAAPLM